MEVGFSSVFAQCVRLGQWVGTTESMPRITGRQCHHSNLPSKSPEEYFRKAITIPLLDHVQLTLESQFSAADLVSVSLIGIVPSICCTREVSLDDALVTYADDLRSAELFEPELRRWTRNFQDMPEEEKPSSSAQAINVCTRTISPISECSSRLPAPYLSHLVSVSCLHNYMRSSMGTERLFSLVPLHVHYNTTVDLDEAVDIFSRLHPRRMELESLIKP